MTLWQNKGLIKVFTQIFTEYNFEIFSEDSTTTILDKYFIKFLLYLHF